MINIFAVTEINAPGYPSYVSLNEVGGNIMLTARSSGNQSGSTLMLTRKELEQLAIKSIEYLLLTKPHE